MLLLLPVILLNIVRVLASYRPEVPITERPFHVSLYLYQPKIVHWCGGSIVHKRAVVTTADCIQGKIPREFWIRTGTGNSKDDAREIEWYDVVALFTHEKFGLNGTGWQYDIGLVIPYKDFTWRNNLQPIEMAMVPPPQFDDVTVAGFGVIIPTFDNRATNLAAINLPKEAPEFCQERVLKVQPLLPNLTETQFCVQDKTGYPNNCIINVGAPVTKCELLIGIVSWGSGCTEDVKTATIFFIDVSPFVGWVWDRIHSYFE